MSGRCLQNDKCGAQNYKWKDLRNLEFWIGLYESGRIGLQNDKATGSGSGIGYTKRHLWKSGKGQKKATCEVWYGKLLRQITAFRLYQARCWFAAFTTHLKRLTLQLGRILTCWSISFCACSSSPFISASSMACLVSCSLSNALKTTTRRKLRPIEDRLFPLEFHSTTRAQTIWELLLIVSDGYSGLICSTAKSSFVDSIFVSSTMQWRHKLSQSEHEGEQINYTENGAHLIRSRFKWAAFCKRNTKTPKSGERKEVSTKKNKIMATRFKISPVWQFLFLETCHKLIKFDEL